MSGPAIISNTHQWIIEIYLVVQQCVHTNPFILKMFYACKAWLLQFYGQLMKLAKGMTRQLDPLRLVFDVCRGNQLLTCSQETMSRQHELRRDLHFAVCVVFEGGEVGLVFVGVHLLPVSVVSCRSKWDTKTASLDSPVFDMVHPLKH